jgi:hypothetical protein
MRRTARATTIATLVLFGAAQFVPIGRSSLAVTTVKGDLNAPPRIKRSLRRACYDCHSNETRWPWYSRIAPASWLIGRHVELARQRLNFSEWNEYASDPGTEIRKLDEIADAMSRGDMAPWYYRVLHPEARLNRKQREAVIKWVTLEATATRNPK